MARGILILATLAIAILLTIVNKMGSHLYRSGRVLRQAQYHDQTQWSSYSHFAELTEASPMAGSRGSRAFDIAQRDLIESERFD